MSKLKLTPNLFLEVNELNKLVDFIDANGYKRAFKAIIKDFGIVKNKENSGFKVASQSPIAGIVKGVTVSSGLAFDSEMEAIVLNENLNIDIQVPQIAGMNKWLVLSRAVTNYESGTVSVTPDGSLTGFGTEFTKVLRGQPNFPVKIKLESVNNIEAYEVVSLINDNSAIIAGGLKAENNVKYSVVGTFTPGFQVPKDNENIYEYDSCNIKVIDSIAEPQFAENEFLLSKISFDNGGKMTITDERLKSQFNTQYDKMIDTRDYKNPLVSLLSSGIVGGIATESQVVDFELIIEHGYNVKSFELSTTQTASTFKILAGECNLFGDGNIPDNTFNGWVLINRKNMKTALIERNTNKALFLYNFNTSIVESVDDDFIIVPNFSEIEYEVRLSSNVDKPDVSFFYSQKITDLKSRMRFYSYFPSVNPTRFKNLVAVKLGYSLIDNTGAHYPFQSLAIAKFENVNGQIEILADSSFNIDMAALEPKQKAKNYS